jgi:hypothetical protein
MMRWTVPSAIVALLLLQPAIQAQAGDSDATGSLARIRAALERPPGILLRRTQSADPPTFRVEIRERLPVLLPVDEKPFDPTFGLPSVGGLLMDGVGKIGSVIADYKRHRVVRRARKEVEDALAAFCAVHECPAADARR